MAISQRFLKCVQPHVDAFLAAAVLCLPCNLIAAPGCPSAPTVAGTDSLPIYSWVDNVPAWDRSLHISGYRIGCDTGDPDGCVRQAEGELNHRDLTRIFLSMDEDPVHTPADALEYSRLSLSRPYLIEAGLDDFVDRYQNLFSKGFDPRPWLREVIRNVKTPNPKLAFGITLYEDEIDSPYTRPPQLPADLASSVDIVHLFLHYRSDAPKFLKFVERARALFPRAKVIAGVYAYDRIDYIPCAPIDNRPCSQAEELSLYRESASIAAQLLKQGKIDGIEFYPGFFGMEDRWGGWKHENSCAPARLAECIGDTRQMRKATLDIFSSTLGWK